ncbi:MAG: UDP-N-acetylmuramoyl-tripeptide--D-alanyl-D-alanine ligase [Synergistaceae bacterium]|nr:UDP-N-acetylmuramoyl-tripeptide--D-alanyl-D-alanine ligase [Synergistaceae bacterium]MBQ6982694.1 UDP-N-acetylmuramoyl-tripeptide--D-alanyl-D-alanine ligase [Synergistaceae bacterium]
MNMKLRDLFPEVAEEFADIEFPNHLATDSRDVEAGGAFIAIEGEKVDGHDYIPQAIENGAGLIIVRKGKKPEGLTVPFVELDEPERDLAGIASKKLKAHNLTDIIGITGSVGKTTTRAALQKVLSPHFKLHAPERSFNTLIGCTATIMAMPLETEILILEFGANKPGEIRELTEYFPPSIAILTAVAPVHLEGFGSVEGVLREKKEITNSANLRKIIFNNDNEYLSEAFRYYVRSMGVGENKDADFVISHDTSEYTLPAMSFVLAHRPTQEIARFTANIWGRHNAVPLSLASAVAHELNISLQECADSLRDFQALRGRGRVMILDGGKRFLVDDAYNANPASMTASLETFGKVKCSGKIAILGEMRELGENSAMYHAEIEPLLEGIETVILVGGIWREAVKGDYIFADDWKSALEALRKIPEWQGLLIKGSNSIGLGNIVKEFEE